jgi:hypothetical protein
MRVLTLIAALLWCGLVAAGCSSSLPDTDLPTERQVAPARQFPGLRDYRGIIDCRPGNSGLTQEKVAGLATAGQIDFIYLTDRAKAGAGAADYGTSGFTSSVLFFAGASFAHDDSGGEILGLNLREPIDPSLAPRALIDAIHSQGGIAVAGRPSRFGTPSDYALADGVEVYSIADAWRATSPAPLYLKALLFGSDRFFSSLLFVPEAELRTYDEMARGARVTLLAGSGAEQNYKVMGSTVGTYPQVFEVMTTHILAPQRQPEPMMEALRRGHAYVAFDLLGYVRDFAFYADLADGGRAMMGDQVPLSSGLTLRAELPAPADEIVLLADGIMVATAERADRIEFQPKSPAAYRIEARRRGHPWVLSNPIYLR